MKRDEVIDKLRALKIQYIQGNVGNNPAALPTHFAEFLGYATLLYDHYAEFIRQYEITETKVIKEENDKRTSHNADPENRKNKDLITVTEVEQRIDIRIGELKAERKRLEQAVKGATLHINGCQSLMKNWGDEAKGVR